MDCGHTRGGAGAPGGGRAGGEDAERVDAVVGRVLVEDALEALAAGAAVRADVGDVGGDGAAMERAVRSRAPSMVARVRLATAKKSGTKARSIRPARARTIWTRRPGAARVVLDEADPAAITSGNATGNPSTPLALAGGLWRYGGLGQCASGRARVAGVLVLVLAGLRELGHGRTTRYLAIPLSGRLPQTVLAPPKRGREHPPPAPFG